MHKTKCNYCGGVTVDDMRGNCGACGAPRSWNNHVAAEPEPLWSVSQLKQSINALPKTGTEWSYVFSVEVVKDDRTTYTVHQ